MKQQSSLTPQDINDALHYAHAVDRRLPLIQIFDRHPQGPLTGHVFIDIDGVFNPPATLTQVLTEYGLEEAAKWVNKMQEAWSNFNREKHPSHIYRLKLASIRLEVALNHQRMATVLLNNIHNQIKQEAS